MLQKGDYLVEILDGTGYSDYFETANLTQDSNGMSGNHQATSGSPNVRIKFKSLKE